MGRIKKQLALLLAVVMLLANTMPVFASVKPLSISQASLKNFEGGKDAEIQFEVVNNGIQEIGAYLITALYNNRTNEMVTYNYVKDTLNPGAKKAFGACIPIPKEGQYTVKTFAWDSLNNPTLLSNIVEVGKDNEPLTYKKVLQETQDFMKTITPEVGAVGGEWAVLGLARNDSENLQNYYDTYYEKVAKEVVSQNTKTKPFGGKITDVQRIAMAITAIGKDATNINGINLIDSTWHKEKYFTGLNNGQQQLGGRQGVNELIFGLLTIDLRKSDKPSDATITRDTIIEKILKEYQVAGGGFSLLANGQEADVDITGMAIQALAPYYNQNNEVKKSIDAALQTLSQLQTQTGSFKSKEGYESSESTSQVLVGLTALGIDPTVDTRFIKNGNNPLTDLMAYYLGDGKFKHLKDGDYDQMATEQAYYALVSYSRLNEGKTALYDMRDVVIQENNIPVTGITLEPSKVVLKKNEKVALKANIQPTNATNKQIQWTTSDEMIAKVDGSGSVTGIANGKAIITATSKEGQYKTTCEVTVESAQEGTPITEKQLNANRYETYYWLAENTYTIDGQVVTFVDNNTIRYGDKEKTFKNKSLTYKIKGGNDLVVQAGEEVTIQFDGGITTPVDNISGQWNSSFGGVIQTVYHTDIEGLPLLQSKNDLGELNTLTFKIPDNAKGTYHLTDGTVYEKANEWSPGISELGSIKEGYFGTLPEITFEIGEPAIGKVTLSIEKRTIGKGDTLSTVEANLYGGDKVWDVIKREMDARNIAYVANNNSTYGSIYIASIAEDGEFDHGNGSGWKYEVNGIFPEVGVSAYTPKVNDKIRLRYCLTPGSQELEKPLVVLLASIIKEAEDFRKDAYTQESFKTLQDTIQEVKQVENNPIYNTKETEKEIVVSESIGKLKEAIANLEANKIPEPPSDIPSDFTNDIGLNKDFLSMKINDTYQIIARRLEEIVDNPISNMVTHPKYHYKVIKGDSVEVDTNGLVRAKSTGTSIIAVTYDQIQANGNNYGAISEINTGLFVVDVIEGIDSGIKLSTNIKHRNYDTIYFTGEYGTFDFSVNAQNADSVTVTVNGETIIGSENNYTTKLKNCSNIIEVEANNSKGKEKIAYVVDARKVEITVANMTDSTRNQDIRVGDRVRVSFKGITPPVYKLATIYNPTFAMEGFETQYSAGAKVEYQCDKLGGTIYGKATQYELATRNQIEFIANEEGAYQFTQGCIDETWWGEPLGADKEMSGPGGENLNANENHDDFSVLPNFEVTVGKATNIPVTGAKLNEKNIVCQPGETIHVVGKVIPEDATNQNVSYASNDEKIAIINADGMIVAHHEGTTTITVTTKEGGFTDNLIVTVVAKRVATDAEKQDLQKLLDEVKNKENKYTDESWQAFQEQLQKVEQLLTSQEVYLNDIQEAKEALVKTVSSLQVDINKDIEVMPNYITTGTIISISLPKLEKPNYDGYPMNREMKTVYQTDIPGIQEVCSENGVDDESLLQIISFQIPETTIPGVYHLTQGHIEASSNLMQIPVKDFQEFYRGQLQDIEIIVLENKTKGRI